MRTHVLLLLGAAALVGCNHDDGNGAGDMANVGGNGDVDMATLPNDLEVNTTPPSPTATHVGATGNTSNLVTAGGHAAYLVDAAPVASSSVTIGIAGELHVTSFDGNDVKVAASVLANRYMLAPDGKSIFYIAFDPSAGASSGAATLEWLSLTAAGATPKQLAAQMPVTNLVSDPTKAAVYSPNALTAESFFSPSGRYFLVAVAPAKESTEPDLHVIDTGSGMDVYQRPNGGALYTQVVLPNDLMLFQDTAGGTGTSSTPVQTLYWTMLPGGTPTPIATKTAAIVPTADNKTVLILGTGGDLSTWDATTRPSAPKALASNVALFTVGGDATGPVAYIGWDHSVHVVGTDGAKKLDLDGATANADLFGAIRLAPDGSNVYFFGSAEPQNKRGTLYRAAVGAAAAPTHVADKASLVDLAVTQNALVFLQNVDDVGGFGDAATAALDGSGVKALGTKSPVGGLRVAVAGSSWYALHLTGAATVAGNAPIDGSPAIAGALAFVDGAAAADTSLDAAVHASAFGFSDDGLATVYAGGAAWDATAKNWLGALTFIADNAPATKIDAKLAGVSEIGPIGGRSLFVSAPGASPAGVYFVRY